MSACMLTAALVVPAGMGESLDFDAGRTVLETIEDPTLFTFEDSDVGLDDDAEVIDENGQVNLVVAKQVGRAIIDQLAEALYSQETNLLHIGQYDVFISGGLSWGDGPTEAAERIWNAHTLPTSVLTAMGFVVDHVTTEGEVDHG